MSRHRGTPKPSFEGGIGQRRPDRWMSAVTEGQGVTPGVWTMFATTCRECPAGCGMHVRCREGRAIKAEGNPDHPVNRGGLCPRGQSAPQGLYDPDRIRRPLRAGRRRTEDGGQKTEPSSGFEPISWIDATHEAAIALANAKRLFIVSDLQTGTLAQVMRRFHTAMGLPGEVVFYEPFAYEALRAANERLFGQAVIPRYRLEDCDFILSFGADFLEAWVSNVEFAWQFARMHHRPPDYRGEMVYIGPRLSMTAANADHFFQVPAEQEYRVALAILREMAGMGKEIGPIGPMGPIGPVEGVSQEAIQALARRFVGAESSVALGGPAAAIGPAAERLATAVMLLNQAAGRVGTTVDFSQTHALGSTIPASRLDEILADLGQGDLLILHETNPAYNLPQTRKYLERAGQIIYLGTMLNETAAMADWVLPVLSPLEAWGDYEPWTGVQCLMQPTMGSLHDAWHSGDVFMSPAAMFGHPFEIADRQVTTFQEWLKLSWRPLHEQMSPDTEFDAFWQQSLRNGGVFEETVGAGLRARPTLSGQSPIDLGQPQGVTATGRLQLWLWPSVLLYDGRPANRGWLQEAPQRMSTVTWQSWLDISPGRAGGLRIANGDIVEVSNGRGAVRVPARVTEDVANNVVALAFGQGHTALGEAANGRGVNAFDLLTGGSDGSLFGAVELRKTGGRAPLLAISASQSQHERGVLQWVSGQELRHVTEDRIDEILWPTPQGYDPRRDLYPPHDYKDHRWAMVVDLDRCIGCGACTVACYAENNIPVVGPKLAGKGREMAWLAVPPYRHPKEPLRVGFLPLPCQHCDAAPCEPVCPVFAAVHNEEGLNAQIYNRCVGTRYCSNNCPYKVRRFGWFDPQWREPLHLQLNPDVTVRCRGVMEKCTFCIQRIHYHERIARVEGRPLRDGEVQPACVQSCPTRTYVFGDLLDPKSEVRRLMDNPRRYQLLKELNTKPAVIYLRRIEPDRPEWA